MNFEFATARRILFGPGKIRELPNAIQGFGRRALVVTGRSRGRVVPVFRLVQSAGITAVHWPLTGEPTVDSVRAGVAHAKEEQ